MLHMPGNFFLLSMAVKNFSMLRDMTSALILMIVGVFVGRRLEKCDFSGLGF